jgi:hypothetical protein
LTKRSFLSFFLSLLSDLGFFVFVVEIANSVFEIKKTFIPNLKGTGCGFTVLHGAEVQIFQGGDAVFAEDGVDVYQDRDALVLFVLITFKDIHCYVSCRLVCLNLDFLL